MCNVKGQTHARSPIKVVKVFNLKERQTGNYKAHGPNGAHYNSCVLDIKSRHFEWIDDGYESI